MKRKRILTQYLLYFIMLMFLLVAGCSSGGDNNDDTADTTVDLWVTVSGTVTTAAGTPVSGVIMSAMFNLEVLNINLMEGSFRSDYFGTCFTDDTGYYTMTVPAAAVENYTLVITPAKKGYTFTPANRTLIIATADQPGVNFTAAVKDVFSQSDLTGTWRVNMLRAGTEQWMRSRISVSATGVATCLSYENSDGVTTCPVATDFVLTMTMGDGDNDGVVTQAGAYATASHMTMSSNKQLMAGTATAGFAASSSYQLTIAQKEPTNLTQYTASDVQNKAFVFHSLSVGAANEWRYGGGYTDLATGLIHQDTPESSSGVAGTTLNGFTIAVAPASGVVTIAEIPTFQGFLSADEMTVVGTYAVGTSVLTDYKLMVIQFVPTVGQASASIATGFSVNHLLATNNTSALWAYQDIDISRFETTFLPDILDLEFALNLLLSYNFECSLPLADFTQFQRVSRISLNKINISDTGEATIEDPDSTTDPPALLFHGQLAYDGKFMVGVETMTIAIGGVDTVFYTLDVITH